MEKERIKSLLKKYGYNTSSFQLLSNGLEYFTSTQNIDGLIAYIRVNDTFVCAGDPLCADEDFSKLVLEFRRFSKDKNKTPLFLQVSHKAKKLFDMAGFGALKFGEEAIFDLETYDFSGGERKSLRWGIRNAQKEGVSAELYSKKDTKCIRSICEEWLSSRKTKGFSFLLSLDPLENKEEKIIFVAKKSGRCVGYLTAVPVAARHGWYFEDIIRAKNAPNGTNQLLVKTAIDHLKSQGAKMASIGTAPLGNILDDETEERKLINKILRYAYNNLNGFYNFKGLHEFKSSFGPSMWEKKYLCFYPDRFRPKYLLAVIAAYQPGGIPGAALSKLQKIITPPSHLRKRIFKFIKKKSS